MTKVALPWYAALSDSCDRHMNVTWYSQGTKTLSCLILETAQGSQVPPGMIPNTNSRAEQRSHRAVHDVAIRADDMQNMETSQTKSSSMTWHYWKDSRICCRLCLSVVPEGARAKMKVRYSALGIREMTMWGSRRLPLTAATLQSHAAL